MSGDHKILIEDGVSALELFGDHQGITYKYILLCIFSILYFVLHLNSLGNLAIYIAILEFYVSFILKIVWSFHCLYIYAFWGYCLGCPSLIVLSHRDCIDPTTLRCIGLYFYLVYIYLYCFAPNYILVTF